MTRIQMDKSSRIIKIKKATYWQKMDKGDISISRQNVENLLLDLKYRDKDWFLLN